MGKKPVKSEDIDTNYQFDRTTFCVGIIIALPVVYLLSNAVFHADILQDSLKATYGFGIMFCLLGLCVALLHGFPLFRREGIQLRRQLEEQLKNKGYFSALIRVRIGKTYCQRRVLIGELPRAVPLFMKLETLGDTSDKYLQVAQAIKNSCDVQLDDQAFDSRFVVTSNVMEKLQQYLSSQSRELLLSLPNVPMQISFVSLRSSEVSFDQPDWKKQLERRYWQVVLLPESNCDNDQIAAVMTEVGSHIASKFELPSTELAKKLMASGPESGSGSWWDSVLGKIILLAITLVFLIFIGSVFVLITDASMRASFLSEIRQIF